MIPAERDERISYGDLVSLPEVTAAAARAPVTLTDRRGRNRVTPGAVCTLNRFDILIEAKMRAAFM